MPRFLDFVTNQEIFFERYLSMRRSWPLSWIYQKWNETRVAGWKVCGAKTTNGRRIRRESKWPFARSSLWSSQRRTSKVYEMQKGRKLSTGKNDRRRIVCESEAGISRSDRGKGRRFFLNLNNEAVHIFNTDLGTLFRYTLQLSCLVTPRWI